MREGAGARSSDGSSIVSEASTRAISSSLAGLGSGPSSVENSRPPMKRADGHRVAEGIDIDQRVARGVERSGRWRRRPWRSPRCLSTRPRRALRAPADAAAARRWNRGCRNGPACPRAGRCAPRWRAGSCPAGRPRGRIRREELSPAQRIDQRGIVARGRVPEIGVAAERGDLGGGNASQPPRPVLRVGQDRSRPARMPPERPGSARRTARRD